MSINITEVRERFISLTDEILNTMIENVNIERYPYMKPQYLKFIEAPLRVKVLNQLLFSCNDPKEIEDQVFKSLTKEFLSSLKIFDSRKNKLSLLKKKLMAYEELIKTEKKNIEEYQSIINDIHEQQ